MGTMSVTLGESLTIKGLMVASRQAVTTSKAQLGSVPKTSLPSVAVRTSRNIQFAPGYAPAVEAWDPDSPIPP